MSDPTESGHEPKYVVLAWGYTGRYFVACLPTLDIIAECPDRQVANGIAILGNAQGSLSHAD